MDGFERRKEQKKQSIRQAALELFQSYGFRRVSIGEIAHKAGVSPVTIYNHFGSKEALVRDVVKTLFLDLMERYRAIIKGEGSFLEKLETIVFDKCEIASQYQGELLRTVVAGNPEIRQFIESIWQNEITQLMFDVIEDGKKEGCIKPEISPEAAMVYLEILRQGLYNSPVLLGRVENNPKLMADLITLFTYGFNG